MFAPLLLEWCQSDTYGAPKRDVPDSSVPNRPASHSTHATPPLSAAYFPADNSCTPFGLLGLGTGPMDRYCTLPRSQSYSRRCMRYEGTVVGSAAGICQIMADLVDLLPAESFVVDAAAWRAGSLLNESVCDNIDHILHWHTIGWWAHNASLCSREMDLGSHFQQSTGRRAALIHVDEYIASHDAVWWHVPTHGWAKPPELDLVCESNTTL